MLFRQISTNKETFFDISIDKHGDIRYNLVYVSFITSYYKQNGEWLCYGTYPIYFNHSDNKDGCNQWVRFSKTGFSPAEYHGNLQ